MTSAAITHLTPWLPPQVNGIGDFCAALADALERLDVDARFLVWRRPWEGADARVTVLDGPRALRGALPDGPDARVLVQYHPSGYAKRQRPRWLPSTLRAWRRAGAARRLGLYVHEMPEPIGIAAGWRGRLTLARRRATLRRLVRTSDVVLTSNDAFAARLARIAGRGTAVRALPVFSNVGEPASVPAWESRDAVCALFGMGYSRAATVTESLDRLREVVSTGAVRRVVEIGPGPSARPEGWSACEWTALGTLAAEEVSRALGRARWAAVAVDRGPLAKSGSFAALAAHGVVPIVGREPAPADGLEPVWLWSGRATPDGAAASAALRAWYSAHGRDATARGVAEALGLV